MDMDMNMMSDNTSSPSTPNYPQPPTPPSVPLPPSVEEMLQTICTQQNQPPPNLRSRRALASLDEQQALEILTKIASCGIRTLDGFIIYMVKKESSCSTNGYDSPSPIKTPCFSSPQNSLVSPMMNLKVHDMGIARSPMQHLKESPSHSLENGTGQSSTPHLEALDELEFRKAFMILSYIGKAKLHEVIPADQVRQLKDLPMVDFESKVWVSLGQHYIRREDRCRYLDWDSGRTHFYHCHVSPDGTYIFKGPFLNKTRTLLQQELGDDNVLLVKLAEEEKDRNDLANNNRDYFSIYRKIAKEGVLVGLRRYKFFVFKDGGKEEKKKDPTSSAVKCYFVCLDSNAVFCEKTIHEARCFFMHAHTVSSISNYMIRLSLILSKTVHLDVDFSRVHVETYDDIPCKDDDGNFTYDINGKQLIHTDGTGFVSPDIALKCPGNIFKGRFANNQVIEIAGRGDEKSSEMKSHSSQVCEPPLLIQFRLFHQGRAVKGTLLVNGELGDNTIIVRPSMIKVQKDPLRAGLPSVNSLEVVGTSNKPKTAFLSKTLIALLSYGGVPNKYFMDLLANALGDAHGVFSSVRAALKASVNHGDMDDCNAQRMILCGIPLDEPHLQHHLSVLMKEEKKSLRGGRIPIPDSYYLMGTADPTETLKSDEVCIILGSGQISGKVLVYRNPGLHFGDIHVLNATYVPELESKVGNSKYAIFFPVKGPRSLADEIAGGDYDGDMYWVSRNPELLKHFKVSSPWTCALQTPKASCKKPIDMSVDELEDELIDLWLKTRFQPCYTVGVAADSWQALMDRVLTLPSDQVEEKRCVERNLHQLINIYYDALDAPKKGGAKIDVPRHLKADVFPHYMEKGESVSYRSTSILGEIYDTVDSFQTEHLATKGIWKLPCFEREVPIPCVKKWEKLYEEYRKEMTAALNHKPEGKRDGRDVSPMDEIIMKYKQTLYGASEFEQNPRIMGDIFDEALAIYNITYDYAMDKGSVGKCGFVWKIAGPALCEFYARMQSERSIVCLPSVLKEAFG